jgi:signal peptidase I
MVPTFKPGDRVFVRDIDGTVHRGDVVIARPPAPDFNPESLLPSLPPEVAAEIAARRPRGTFKQIARVVGVGGDRIEVRDGRLSVNGEAAIEPYLAPGTLTRVMEPVEIPAGHVYLMGDNRPDSRDSQYYGPIPVEDVESVVAFRYWPPGRLGRI